MHKYLNKHWILKIRVMLRGLPGINTKSVLVLARLWALPTLGRVFSCTSWSFSLQDTSTNIVLWFGSAITCFTSTRCPSSVSKWDATNADAWIYGSAIGNPSKRASKTCTRSQWHEREHDAMQCNAMQLKRKTWLGKHLLSNHNKESSQENDSRLI